MEWEILDTGVRTAEENMALDEGLLLDLEHCTHPILHLYDWKTDAATYGHFIDPGKYLNLEGARSKGLTLAKRPTGGGIVFHNCDLAFSVLVPSRCPVFSMNTLENYAFVNRHVMWVVEQFLGKESSHLLPIDPKRQDAGQHFCMAKPTKYDVMVGGRKVGGAAQRKTRHGFLHQGSIAIGILSEAYLKEILLSGTTVLEAMKQTSYPLIEGFWGMDDLISVRSRLRGLLVRAFSEELRC